DQSWRRRASPADTTRWSPKSRVQKNHNQVRPVRTGCARARDIRCVDQVPTHRPPHDPPRPPASSETPAPPAPCFRRRLLPRVGLPLLLTAGAHERWALVSARLRRHQLAIQIFGPVLLLILGLLPVTGGWDYLTDGPMAVDPADQ